MSVKCPECQSIFTYQDALCEDWRDPNRSFGCPNCETFFVKDMRPKFRESIIAGIIGGGIGTPAGMMIGHYFSSGDIVNLIFGGTILLILVAIFFIKVVGMNNKLVKVPQDISSAHPK